MAGFVDVLLRGLILVLTSVVLGGVAWTRLVLRAEPHAKPDPATAIALRVIAAAACAGVLAQGATMAVALGALSSAHGHWPAALYFDTSFARTALVRMALGVTIAVFAVKLARGPAGRGAWLAITAAAFALTASSAALSHAVARVDHRALLMALDAAHQTAAALWVGGLVHLVVAASTGVLTRPESRDVSAVVRRFSTLAFWSVMTLLVAGVALTWVYVGDLAALVGTAYGIMILSKVALLSAALALAYANLRFVRRATAAPGVRLFRFVEVEMGLVITVLFAAASLTSLPPAVDVTTDRATVAEVAARFTPTVPRLSSPPIDELLKAADPLMARQLERKPVERAWSEYNHHWAGLFVLTMGVLAALERLGVRAARHWPLVFLGLATFLFIRNDPRAWPLGPAGFWESLMLPDVLQHRGFVAIIVAFGVFEWMVRTNRLPARPWAFVFPLLCAVGGGLLLTHSHAMFNLKEEFLTEVTHAPLGILGAFAGWGRWLELRLPEAGRGPGWLWIGCLSAVGALLVVYREG
jgi:putative copper resistance protein D